MQFAKRLFMLAGGLALVGLASVLFFPKAAHAAVSALVTVANNVGVVNPAVNGVAQPLVTTDTDGTARQPAVERCTAISSSSAFDKADFNCNLGAVPAGKQLVIEEVTASCFANPSVQVFSAGLGLGNAFQPLVLVFQGTAFGVSYYVVSEKVLLYAGLGG